MDRNWDEVVATEQTAFDGWYGTLLRWAVVEGSKGLQVNAICMTIFFFLM